MIDCYFEFLPSSIGRMCNLQVLELRDNQLTDLPQSIQKLTKLKRLDLGSNMFADWVNYFIFSFLIFRLNWYIKWTCKRIRFFNVGRNLWCKTHRLNKSLNYSVNGFFNRFWYCIIWSFN